MKLGDIFIKLGLQKEGFEKGINEAKKTTSSFGNTFGKISTLAVGAWAAIGVGAVAAFNKIKNSTDTLSTQWEIFMGGMTSATDEFFRSIATGNWSNFIDNMKEAIRVGRDYADVLDQIEEMQRAGSVAEAKMLKQNTQLEIDAANQSLSIAQRKSAAEQRIKNEEELGRVREKIAQKIYDNEKSVTMQATKLSGDQLESVIADLDSMDKEKAKSYNAEYDRLIKINSSKKQVEAELSKRYTENEKLYAQSVRQMGDATDEQLNKMVAAYMSLAQAQESVLSNTRRIRMRLSGFDNKETAQEQKATDPIDELFFKSENDINANMFATREKNIDDELALDDYYIDQKKKDQETLDQIYLDQQKAREDADNAESEANKKKISEIDAFNTELNSIIANGMTNAIATFTAGLTELAMGEISGKEFGKQILGVIGEFMVQMGMAFITFSSLFIAFKAAIGSMNGPLALGIGIALVAAGSAISSVAKHGMSKGATGSNPASGYSSNSGSSAITALTGNVVFELQGTTLRGVLNNQDRKNSLIR